MYRQFGNTHYRDGFAELGHDRAAIAQSGQLDALVALECIGTRLSFSRNDFGVNGGGERGYSAEAVDDVIVMRYQRKATERLIDQNPALARHLRDAMLRDLANAHGRTLLLGRMTATERVATFLLEMFDRRDRTRGLELPMPRTDIADYLGLTIETVCRILSLFKRDGVIAIPSPHRIELLDREALEALGEA